MNGISPQQSYKFIADSRTLQQKLCDFFWRADESLQSVSAVNLFLHSISI
ncbi:hypothetical protein EVA_01482 [gut metagenome]|uniref:Uncharacterized protein n=1 Tax=gut metagenome TaxID=749906 RepID=J9DBN4_9ZZZZ